MKESSWQLAEKKVLRAEGKMKRVGSWRWAVLKEEKRDPSLRIGMTEYVWY